MQYANPSVSVGLSCCSQSTGIHCLPSNTHLIQKRLTGAQQHRQEKAISGSDFKKTLPTSEGNLL